VFLVLPIELLHSSSKATTYSLDCLKKSDGCIFTEYQAAVYDYVGALYGGEPDKVLIDEKLLPRERKSVEKVFGKLSDKQGTAKFLSQARELFFKKGRYQQEPSYKCQGMALKQFSSPSKGEGFLIGTVHGCLKEQGEILFSEGLELDIASSSDQWVFFIEGILDSSSKGAEAARADGICIF